MGKSGKTLTFGIVVSIGLLVSGCVQDGPLEPAVMNDNPASEAQRVAECTVGSENGNEAFVATKVTRVVLPRPNQPSDSLFGSVTATPDSGGEIKLSWSNYDATTKKTSTVSMKLQIPPGAVSEPTRITMAVDPNAAEISAEFGPHGLVFPIPLHLDVVASGLDLTAFSDTDRIDLWYVHSAGWEEAMQYRRISVVRASGMFVAKDIQLPHFSRYCFGR